MATIANPYGHAAGPARPAGSSRQDLRSRARRPLLHRRFEKKSSSSVCGSRRSIDITVPASWRRRLSHVVSYDLIARHSFGDRRGHINRSKRLPNGRWRCLRTAGGEGANSWWKSLTAGRRQSGRRDRALQIRGEAVMPKNRPRRLYARRDHYAACREPADWTSRTAHSPKIQDRELARNADADQRVGFWPKPQASSRTEGVLRWPNSPDDAFGGA